MFLRKILFLLLLPASVLSSYAEDYTPAASFLKIGVGARQIAMGETGVAATSNADSVYWNPAGLANLSEKKELSLMHATWLETVNYEHLAFARKGSWGVFAGSVDYLHMAKMDKYTNEGLSASEKFGAYDQCVSLSYANKVRVFEGKGERHIPVTFGVTIKQISSRIEAEKASTYALDYGMQARVMREKLRFGFAIQNLGSGLKFRQVTTPLPVRLRVGAALVAPFNGDNPITLAVEGVIPRQGETHLNVGMEYQHKVTKGFSVSPRAGYRFTHTGLEAGAGLAAGMGFSFNVYTLDYAFVPFGELGNTHRLSLVVKW